MDLKKTGMWLAIIILYHADNFLGLEGNLSLMTGAIYFFMANEAISIAENYGRMKLPMPSQLKSLIAVLKEKGEQR
ncbi:phage holin family protein [Paenibacillus pasadenensis]|uniref:phage holin family protein n=1 Tax=Paenibacillus pasadenensis TaxID=217090 RepID=UPI00333FA686